MFDKIAFCGYKYNSNSVKRVAVLVKKCYLEQVYIKVVVFVVKKILS